MTVRWSPSAIADLSRLRDFLAERESGASARAAGRILEAADALRDHPNRGKVVEGLPEFREVVAPFGAGAYVLRYEIHGGDILVVRVWHSREARR